MNFNEIQLRTLLRRNIGSYVSDVNVQKNMQLLLRTIFTACPRGSMVLNKYESLNTLSYNTFMVMVLRNLKAMPKYSEVKVEKAVSLAIIETKGLMGELEKIASRMTTNDARNAFYHMMNKNHLAVMLLHSELNEYILTDLKQAMQAHFDQNKQAVTYTAENMFELTHSGREMIIERAMVLLQKHGGQLSKYNEKGEVMSNLNALGLDYCNDILSLHKLVNGPYKNLNALFTMMDFLTVIKKTIEPPHTPMPLLYNIFFFLSPKYNKNTTPPLSQVFEAILNSAQKKENFLTLREQVAKFKLLVSPDLLNKHILGRLVSYSDYIRINIHTIYANLTMSELPALPTKKGKKEVVKKEKMKKEKENEHISYLPADSMDSKTQQKSNNAPPRPMTQIEVLELQKRTPSKIDLVVGVIIVTGLVILSAYIVTKAVVKGVQILY
ncbi:hypothetical protein NEAUS07_1262 [Nematocida ausubeli]|nr:hypothetical protein NEAUS07_1262 [Nematocida ausubeli]